MDASTPTIMSGAGSVSSRQSPDPELRDGVIQTHQLEHPSTRSKASKIFAMIFAIYHMLYSAAWLIGFIVLTDYYEATRWIAVIVTGAVSVCRLNFYAQFLLGDGMGLYDIPCSTQLFR